jgi:hypothetical protein
VKDKEIKKYSLLGERKDIVLPDAELFCPSITQKNAVINAMLM